MDIKGIIKTKNLYSSERINQIVFQLNLKPFVTPEKFIEKTKGIKHRYYTPCVQNGKKYFFYALLKKEKKSKEKFLKELRLANFLINTKPKQLLPHLPNYIKTSLQTSQPPWILVDWTNNPVLEDKKNAEVSIHKLNYKETKQLVETIIKINQFLQNTDWQKKLKIEKFNLKQAWQKIISNLEILYHKGFKHDKIKVIKKNLNSDFQLWNKENHYFCHGDLHLGNIIYHKVNSEISFKIIDWELYHINNFAYDVSFLFSRLWQERKMRNDLIKKYLSFLPKNKIEVFKKLFKANLTYFAIIYGLKSSPLEFTKAQVKKRQAWFKKLINLYFTNFGNYLKI